MAGIAKRLERTLLIVQKRKYCGINYYKPGRLSASANLTEKLLGRTVDKCQCFYAQLSSTHYESYSPEVPASRLTQHFPIVTVYGLFCLLFIYLFTYLFICFTNFI